jgi:Protein of unknown function (DUF4038)/Putative collagen-binding domain of a collagenase
MILCRSVALGSALALGALACASVSGSPPEPFAIRPTHLVLEPGATEQMSVVPEAGVRWGIAESASNGSEAEPVYPLTVSDDGRYLVDQRGEPWRVQADAGWLMSSQATPDEVDQYLSTRQAQGFNSFYLAAMVHPGGYDAAPHAPDNYAGDPPFATPGDFSTAGASPASERYWTWIDSIVEKAAAHGMVVMLAYTYLGYEGGDQGWYAEVLDQPDRRALVDWGRWIGNRYKDSPNIIWLGLGDYTPPPESDGVARAAAIAEGIKSAGAAQPFMAEPSGPDQIPGDITGFGSVVDTNSFYGYGEAGEGAVYETADRAWRSAPTKPAWMQEGTYEYENNSGHFTGQPWETRRGRFWSVLAGGTAGDGFGSRDAWQVKDFPASLSTPGADYASVAFDLFETLPWWELRPSGTDPGFAGTTLISSGQGTWGGADYITSAVTDDHDWLLAYVPVIGRGVRTFAVDMTAMTGTARARWFDPATGTYLAISKGYELDSEGTRTFTTPGLRGDDTDDWLLVLDSTGTPRCGTVTVAGVYTTPASPPDGVDCRITASLEDDPSVVASARLTFRTAPAASGRGQCCRTTGRIGRIPP